MPEFEAHFDLSEFFGEAGSVWIRGEAAGDRSGIAVSGAGDVNGDGFDDVILGAPGVGTERGAAYLVYGRAEFAFNQVDLTTLDGSNGFAINGEADNSRAGAVVSSAGDVNGDGVDDFLVGAHAFSAGGFSYVVFGSSTGFPVNFDLAGLNGANGFRIEGPDPFNITRVVSAAGDFNGDGFGDVLVGAPAADNVGAYVVFGRAQGSFSPAFDLADLSSNTGFRITNTAEPQSVQLGAALASGDFDGDGFDDLIIGAPTGDANNRGYVAVVYGRTGGGVNVDVAQLNGSNGFQIHGEQNNGLAGASVGTCDINADGRADIIIGAPRVDAGGVVDNGATYVIYGGAGRGYVDVNLATLLPGDGFAIDGEGTNNMSGRSVSSAGDVNGDGFEDLLIGAPQTTQSGANSGAAYVLFGKASGFSNINLNQIDGSNGFVVNGAGAGNLAGFSVSAAGDFNADGFDDVIVGAYGNPQRGAESGASYVVFGHRALEAVNRQGTDLSQTINGGVGRDTVFGSGGADTLIGWEDNDRLEGGLGRDVLRGGAGSDSYFLTDNFFTLDRFTRGVDTIVEEADQGAFDRVFVTAFSDGRRGVEGYTLTANVENGYVFGDIDFNLNGNEARNNLEGAGGDNTVRGLGGDDTLEGQGGIDRLEGGAGDDVYRLTDAALSANGSYVLDAVVEAAGAGRDFVSLEVDDIETYFTSYVLPENVEDVSVSSVAGFTLTGNGLANFMTGGIGNDNLAGLAGADTMSGLFGNDRYNVDDAGDRVQEISGPLGGGVDRVYASVNYRLADFVENLTLLDGASDGIGNALANILVGNDDDNALNGLAGADTMAGGLGNDRYVVDSAGDDIREATGTGVDLVQASVTHTLAVNVDNLRLGGLATTGNGNALKNEIFGTSRNNVLDGKAGSDTLQGNSGRDTFAFTTTLGASNVDLITDFNVADDTIRLDATVFAGLATGTLAASAFRTGGAAADASDRIIHDRATGSILFDRDGVGGAAAIRFAVVDAGLLLTSADFTVVA